MKIQALRVQWYPGAVNTPDWQGLIDERPDFQALIYRRIAPGAVFAESPDGFVSFGAIGDEHASGPRGYAGRKFVFRMDDGSKITSTNVWSSSPAAFNALGCTPCADFHWTEQQDDWERGFTFMAGAVTVETLEQALAAHPVEYGGKQVVIHPMDFYGQPLYTATLEGMTPAESKAWLQEQGVIRDPYARRSA